MIKQKMILIYSVLSVAFMMTATASAGVPADGEGSPIVIGQTISFDSKILGEERELYIHLPHGYEESEQRYPVLYLLDGEGHFEHAVGVADYLASLGYIPRMIVVGIPNTDRGRDMAPTPKPDDVEAFPCPTCGGADNFIRFLNDECIPYVDSAYRTHPYRIVFGHSLAGLFAIHALTTSPGTFGGYITPSPSVFWDRALLMKNAGSLFETKKNLRKSFYFTRAGDEHGVWEAFSDTMTVFLEAHAPEGFDWNFRVYEDEDHNTAPHRTILDGLRHIYSGWVIRQAVASEGLEPTEQHYRALSEKYGYTIAPPEHVLNFVGYQYLLRDEIDQAISIFERNVKEHPNSFNVYDSLGEAYAKKGETEKAVANYKRSLELNPANLHAAEVLKSLGEEK